MAGVSLSYAPLQLPPSYKRYLKTEGSIPYASSNQVALDKDGLLLGVIIRFSGTVTTGATAPVFITGVSGASNSPAPWNIASPALQVAGPGTPIGVPGEIANIFAQLANPLYSDQTTWLPASPAASTVYPVEFGYYLPICVRDDEFYGEPADHVGAIYTGDPSITAYIGLTPNPSALATWFTVPGNGTLAGNWTVTSVKLDAPQPSTDPSLLAAISWYHALQLDMNNPLVAVGQQVWTPTVNTVRTYLRLATFFRNNAGSGDASLASAAFTGGMMATLLARAEGIVTWWDTIAENVQLAYQALAYQGQLTRGVYTLDLQRSGDRSQWFDVSSVTSLTITEAMNAVTLTGAKFQTVYEFLQPSPLAQRWFQQASSSVLKNVQGA